MSNSFFSQLEKLLEYTEEFMDAFEPIRESNPAYQEQYDALSTLHPTLSDLVEELQQDDSTMLEYTLDEIGITATSVTDNESITATTEDVELETIEMNIGMAYRLIEEIRLARLNPNN